ncbi:ABC transporter permease [Pseudoalteromonas sp. Of11M-6]|uniref:ABC transporter permease n=1 Tax=Pseudoalteromonas sp. Of11M-6 TaxID=2917754 RepID=UPI001EF4F5AB|nr:ABC transporter permease [Pseudoalteromonas sp. Of11M-6]MCG7555576.1 ABC transporter permease [Pseudoalteromonas sp. Of11M-6]
MLKQEIQSCLYSLSKAKIFTLTIIITLGITLGTLIAMFNLNFQILAAPLPYHDSEKLYVSKTNHYIKDKIEFEDYTPMPILVEAYKNEKSDHIQTALFAYGEEVIRSRADTPRVNVAYTTPEFMPLLGFNFELGRGFSDEEGIDSISPVAVLSYHSWQTYFGADPQVLGKTFQIDQVNFRIIGVLSENTPEPELYTPGRLTSIWLPWDYLPSYRRDAQQWGLTGPNRHILTKILADEDIAKLNHQLTNKYNGRFKAETAGRSFFNDMTITLELKPLKEKIHGDSASRTIWLLVGAFCLTLIACANIANLVLARAVNQQRTMSIKAALGAQRKQIVRGIFIELATLTLLSAILALGVSELCYYLLKLIATDSLPSVARLTTNVPSVIFCLTLSALLAWLGAWLISAKINFSKLNSQIQSSGKGTSIQVKSSTRSALIFSQIFLASLLLISCFQIFINSWSLLSQAPNFVSKDRYQVELNQLFEPRPSRAERDSYYSTRRQQLLDIVSEIRANPRVVSASLTTGTPVEFGISTFLSPDSGFENQYSVSGNLIDEAYIPTLQLDILQGRNFTREDVYNRSPYLIVNKEFANKLKPGGDVVGERYYWLNGRRTIQYEIIAVTEDLNLPEQSNSAKMWAVDNIERYAPSFIIEVDSNQQLTPQFINSIIAKTTPTWRVSDIQPLESQLANSLALHYIASWASLALAIVTLSIAVIGIYGVLSYGISMRKFELGVRMAIGASPLTIVKGVILENFKVIILALIGAAIIVSGVAVWITSTRFTFALSTTGLILPIVTIIAVTAFTSTLAVWGIIRRPAIYSLRDQ